MTVVPPDSTHSTYYAYRGGADRGTARLSTYSTHYTHTYSTHNTHRGGADGGAVGALRHVQHAARVARELGDAHHRGVLPQDELVVRVAVRADELLVVRRPLQRADLGGDNQVT